VSKTVGEMQTKIDEAKADKSVFAKLREVLGIGDDKDIVEAVTRSAARWTKPTRLLSRIASTHS